MQIAQKLIEKCLNLCTYLIVFFVLGCLILIAPKVVVGGLYGTQRSPGSDD
jgi:hypothetical protein